MAKTRAAAKATEDYFRLIPGRPWESPQGRFRPLPPATRFGQSVIEAGKGMIIKRGAGQYRSARRRCRSSSNSICGLLHSPSFKCGMEHAGSECPGK